MACLRWNPVTATNSSRMRPRSARLPLLYRSMTAATSSSRVAMLTRLIDVSPTPSGSGAFQMRQQINIREHFWRGNAVGATVQAHVHDDQSWDGAVGDENDQNGRVSGAIADREQDQNTPAARHGFRRGSGPDQQAHEQPEIVPGDMDQIALVDILPAPQPRLAHPTSVQDVSKGALDDFRPVAHRLLAYT